MSTGEDDLPFPPLPFLLFLSAWDFGEGVGSTDAASLFAFALGRLGGSPVDDAAASFSFLVLTGAAGLSASSKAGVVLLEDNDSFTARSLSFNSRSCFPRAMYPLIIPVR